MAVRFDAATDRVSYTASSPPALTTGITVCFWAYLSVDRDDFSTMCRLHSSSGSSTAMNIATGGSGTSVCIFSPGNTGGVVAPTSLVVGQWRAVAVSVTGTSGTVYVAPADLSSVGSASGTVSGGGAPDGLTFGGRAPADGSEWFNGRLAYARIYSAVLSQAEIEAEWASRTRVRTSNSWASYPLSGVGDLADDSGNGRNLSAGTTAVTTEDGPPLSSTVTGTALAALSAPTGSATGHPRVAGGASAALPAPAATVTGRRGVAGTALAPLAALVATAAGRRAVAGVALASLPALVAAATGARAVAGVAAAALAGPAATATGRRAVAGQAAAPLGALVAMGVQFSAADIIIATGPRRWAATAGASQRWVVQVAER